MAAHNSPLDLPLTEIKANSLRGDVPLSAKTAAPSAAFQRKQPSNAGEALEVLASLQHVEHGVQMAMLDALAGCESAMAALVSDAQTRMAQARAEAVAAREASETAAMAERLGRRRRKADLELSNSASGESSDDGTKSPLQTTAVPFWVDVTGALRLVRMQVNLKSAEVGRLELGSRVAVLEKRQSSDGAWRAAVALENGGGKLFGWMTLVTRDGVENVTFVDPQPPAVTLPPPLRSCASSSSSSSVADGGGGGGSARGGGGASRSTGGRSGEGGGMVSRFEGMALTPRSGGGSLTPRSGQYLTPRSGMPLTPRAAMVPHVHSARR